MHQTQLCICLCAYVAHIVYTCVRCICVDAMVYINMYDNDKHQVPYINKSSCDLSVITGDICIDTVATKKRTFLERMHANQHNCNVVVIYVLLANESCYMRKHGKIRHCRQNMNK